MADVLIADDPHVSRMLSDLLGRDGHLVRTSASFAELERALVQRCPQVLLLDWKLQEPGDAPEVIRLARERCPHLHAVLYTLYWDEAWIGDTGRALGIGTILPKPCGLVQLRTAIREAAVASILRRRQLPEHDRRLRARRRLEPIAVEVESASENRRGWLTNVSQTGLFVRSATLPELGSLVRLSFEFPPGETVAILGYVCWNTAQIDLPIGLQSGFGLRVADDSLSHHQAFYERVLRR